MINETQLLNDTLDLINDEETTEAYNYLIANKHLLDSLSGQVYNFLYCLAATSDKKKEALDWLEEAIIEKKLWYRPEVFEDEDLDCIRDDIRFKSCCRLSEERCLVANKNSKSLCTWSTKESTGIILSLHGNQQNNEINQEYWKDFNSDKYQVEYLQSKEIDSFQLFRWEDNGTGPLQLQETIDSIEWNNYEHKILSGFSAGCNVILNAIKDTNISCNKIILQSPWMPVVESGLDNLIKELIKKNIEILLICGEEDNDCLPLCKILEEKAVEDEIKIKCLYIKKLGHDYPKNFNELVLDFIK